MVRTGDASRLYDYEETKRVQNETVSPADKALPFIHLAYEALLYVPFSFLRYQQAYALFFVVNVVLLVCCDQVTPFPQAGWACVTEASTRTLARPAESRAGAGGGGGSCKAAGASPEATATRPRIMIRRRSRSLIRGLPGWDRADATLSPIVP